MYTESPMVVHFFILFIARVPIAQEGTCPFSFGLRGHGIAVSTWETQDFPKTTPVQ